MSDRGELDETGEREGDMVPAWANVLSGLVIALFGATIAIRALTALDLGTARQLGPGMFPAGTGLLLVLTGAIIIIQARGSLVPRTPINWRAALVVLGAIIVFGLVIDRFGTVPALFALVLVASFASDRLSLRTALVIAAFLCVVVIGVFKFGLGMPLDIFRWPF